MIDMQPVPAWLAIMRAGYGISEMAGDADNPYILGMSTFIGQAFPDLEPYSREYNHDSIPWCGLRVAYCVAKCGFRPVTKADGAEFGYLWAPDWQYFGVPTEPRLGAIMVFAGHVAMYEGETANAWKLGGGNQADAINVINYSKNNKLLGCRWART